MKIRVILSTVALVISTYLTFGVQNVRLSVQDNAVVLRWPSTPGQSFIIAYRPDLQPGTPWTFLQTAYAAASSGAETTYMHADVVVIPDPPLGGAGGEGPPPPPGGSSLASGDSSVSSSGFDSWMYEGREPYTWEIEQRPPYPWDPEVQSTGAERQSFSASDTTQSTSESLTALPSSGSMGFYFVTEYEEDLDSDGLPNGTEVYLGTHILKPDSDGDNISDGAEDADADGDNNLTESLVGSDPVVADSGTWQPPSIGGVYSGEAVLSVPAGINLTKAVGPMLDANGYTADSLVTTAPTPTSLRLRWNSTFIDGSGAFAQSAGDPRPTLTPEEVRLLQNAFGKGTSGGGSNISSPDQAKVDAIPRETLEKYEQVAVNQLRKDFKWIQDVNSGVIEVPPDLERSMTARIGSIHTQFTRLTSITDSLARRFGRAISRVVPFLGGILVLANAEEVAENFYNAAQDYARDIANGDDETGSAAILAGRCNDLAPGSGNIVLDHLLR